MQNVSELISVISKRLARDFYLYGADIVCDLDLLQKLRRNKGFVKENKRLWEFYAQLNLIANQIEKRSGPDAVHDALDKFYDDIRQFMNRWKTVPLPPCIFQIEVPNPARARKYFQQVCAASLPQMARKTIEGSIGNHYRYIRRYADKLKMSVHSACLKVLSDVEKVLYLIIHNNTEGEAIPFQKVA